MKGDFTRDTFEPGPAEFYRVMIQQGRVQLDADWNEQIAILLRRLEMLAGDVFGPSGGPEDFSGFKILYEPNAIEVTRGRYYVEGLLCENSKKLNLALPPDSDDAQFYICYLDAYEEYVAAVQDPAIADVALGGLDTAGRSRVRWSVKFLRLKDATQTPKWDDAWQEALPALSHRGRRGALRARAEPDFGFSGAENQLYRVEIHESGTTKAATWKWSRANGSVAFAATATTDSTVELRVGPAQAGAIVAGDWVEITDDDDAEDDVGKNPLLLVTQVDGAGAKLTVAPAPPSVDVKKHPICRRWDQKLDANGNDLTSSGGCLPLTENGWLTLESGVQVLFAPPKESTAPHHYRGGDYWQIPARTATASMEWPHGPAGEGPAESPPRGIRHRYAPLGGLSRNGKGFSDPPVDLRILRKPLPSSS